MRSRLERAADIATLLGALALVGYVGHNFYRTYFPAPAPPDFRVGQSLSDTDDLQLRSAPLTLLLVTASTCRYCTASMPFYVRVLDQAKSKRVRVVALTQEDLDQNRQYLMSHQVTPDAVASAQNNGIWVRGTPTLILVGSDGKVRQSWRGRLPPDREAEVLKALE